VIQAFIMILREGFESFLIVAIILSYLRTLGRKDLLSAVYLGVIASLLVSGALGYLLMKGVNQALWEGVLGLVTVVMVATLVVQMWRTAPRLKKDIQNHLRKFSERPPSRWTHFGIFFFTVLMVSREGMETALMLIQVRDGGMVGGILLGLVAAVFLGWLWIRYSRLINLKRFFQVTGIYFLLFLVQVLIYSFHEFSEAGVFPNSEAIHLATEPYSPYGIYGQWFSFAMIGACALWLIVAWILDRSARGQKNLS